MNDLTPAGGGRVARFVWELARDHRRGLLVAVALFAVTSLTGLAAPIVVGRVVDDVASGHPEAVGWWLAGLAGVLLLGAWLSWLATMALARVAEPLAAELRERFIRATLRLPREQFETAGSGDLLTRASDDVALVSENLPTVLPQLLRIGTSAVVIGIGLGVQDWRFAVVALLVLPMLAWITRWYLKVAPPTWTSERRAQSVRSRELLDVFRPAATVRAYGLEQRQLDRVRGAAWEYLRWQMRQRIVTNILISRMGVMELLGLLCVLATATWLVLHGEITLGAATTASLLFLQIMEPLADFLMIVDELQLVGVALARLVVVIDRPRPVAEEATGAAVVELAGVGFAYGDGPEVLHDIDLVIQPGQHVALVGATGSGKSTLALIVGGILQPQRGARRRGASRVLSVSQESHVFDGTLRDNLTLAAPGVADERIIEVLDQIGAQVLLRDCPDGLDTRIGGHNHVLTPALSQHLALARVQLAEPDVVVLDEATAEAGSADARGLEEVAAAVLRGRSALVVAHRLSQAAQCDRILVLDHGRVVEEGSHDELLAQRGRYAVLWETWNR